MSEIFNTLLALGGAGAGIYGAIRAWLSNRKMKQIEEEKISMKLKVDFNYEILNNGPEKLVHGIITWTNLGLTNLKFVSLNVDIWDSEREMKKSFKDDYKPLSNKISNLELKAINNHKFLKVTNDPVRFYLEDSIYGLESSRKRVKREERISEGEEILRMKGSIENYIQKKVAKLKSILENKSDPDFEKKRIDFLFFETMVKELRGIQLFPGDSQNQDFYMSYKGEGLVYLNIESATIRYQLKSIDPIENYKSICEEIIESKTFSRELSNTFEKSLKDCVEPANYNIQKQKSNHLIYVK